MKMIIILIIAILSLTIVYGADNELFISGIGDEELYILPFGDAELNNYFVVTESTTTSDTSVGGGAAPPWEFRQLGRNIYDVRVEVWESTYKPGDEITATITLTNIGDIPDKDTILRFYLTDPNGEQFGLTQEQFLEVPPITYRATQCAQHGGSTETGNCVTTLQRSLYVPLEGAKGEWRFTAEYETEVQPLIKVFDPFVVIRRLDLIIGLILLVLFLYNEIKGKKWI